MKLEQEVLYGVTTDGGTVELGRSPVLFELLETYEFPENHNFIGIAIHTTGWSAPLNRWSPFRTCRASLGCAG